MNKRYPIINNFLIFFVIIIVNIVLVFAWVVQDDQKRKSWDSFSNQKKSELCMKTCKRISNSFFVDNCPSYCSPSKDLLYSSYYKPPRSAFILLFPLILIDIGLLAIYGFFSYLLFYNPAGPKFVYWSVVLYILYFLVSF